ncbi:MAG: YggS family pyridoxal phosphate-dependent enzyme [Candidatus Neomarinimicrobiota bacterium]
MNKGSAILKDRLRLVREKIVDAQRRSGNSGPVKIIAVTKTQPIDMIVAAYESGIRCIGENKVQEANAKFFQLTNLAHLEKRMIGHLQSNKINKALQLFDTIDSIDSVKLASKISQVANAEGRTIPTQLEINTSKEPAKFGFDPHDIDGMLACCNMDGIVVDGLMTVGPLINDMSEVRKAFNGLFKLREELNRQLGKKLQHLSMGMSGDFEIAVELGSTMVRLGTILFGERRQ